MRDPHLVLKRIREILSFTGDRVGKARRLTSAVREAGGYRWVGVYDVTADEIGIFAWSGPGAPAHPRFPATDGLCGAAVRSRAVVAVGDVTEDPRYLTTLVSTRSEIVVPISDTASGSVVGLIDVESERPNAFTAEDQRHLESCAAAMRPLWE